MDLFGVLSLFGGLALFLFGMETMEKGLTNLSGGRMEALLSSLTSNRLKAVLLGLLVTAVIQSSSATTVMVVGFVNSGIMQLAQAAGVIMGANIGTTVTAWLISLTGIEGDALWLQLLKPSSFSPVLAVIGIIYIMFSKEAKKKNVGMIMIGFAVLMYGMEGMSSAVEPLADDPAFTSLMTAFQNPILSVAAGAVLTGIIQSSSASVGILQALCMTGSVPYSVAIPVIMGQNIGTCVTALLSSIGASKNARRAAMIHLYFNLIGVTLFLVGFYLLHAICSFEFLDEAATPAGIAMFHSIFNVTVTVVLFPFLDQLVALARFTIPDSAKDTAAAPEAGDFARLDERFLMQPAVAVEQSHEVLISMAEKSMLAMKEALNLFYFYNEEKAQEVEDLENQTDRYEDVLGSYLVKTAEQQLSGRDSERVSLYLQNIGDLERIADHAANLVRSFREVESKKISFSTQAREDLMTLISAVSDVTTLTMSAMNGTNSEAAADVEPLEQVVDSLVHSVRERHIARLREGSCTLELGYILADVTTNLERVSDHCSNLASSLICEDKGGYDTHEYLTAYKQSDNEEFQRRYQQMASRYQLY